MTTTIDTPVSGLAVEVRVTTDRPDITAPLTVWKSVAGAPRTVVRGLDALKEHGTTIVVLDYEIPYGVPILYTAECGPDYVVASASATVVSNQMWLRDVLFPGKSMTLCLVQHQQTDRTVRTVLLRASGRRNPIAVTDVREGQVGTTIFATKNPAERTQFLALVDTGNVLMMTGPATWQLGPLYLVPLGVKETRPPRITKEERVWEVEWNEVDPPATPILGTPEQWNEVDDNTWNTVNDKTWFDTVYPPAGGGQQAMLRVVGSPVSTGPPRVQRWIA